MDRASQKMSPISANCVMNPYMERETNRASTNSGEDTVLACVDLDKVANRVLDAYAKDTVHSELHFGVAVTRLQCLRDAPSLHRWLWVW